LRDYRLAYPAPASTGAPEPGVLHVAPFAVAAAYDSQAMIYRQGEFRVGRYPHDRWAANPGNLIADLLARDFDSADTFRAVQHSRAPLPSNYRLAAEIDVIEEAIEPAGCFARLEVRVLLIRLGTTPHDPVLMRHTYRESEPTRCEDARALASAMSSALARISESLRRDVVAAVQRATAS